MLRLAWTLPLCLSLAACGAASKQRSEPPADPFRDERPARSSETETGSPNEAAPDSYSEGAVPEDEFESDSSGDEEIEIEIEESEDDFDTELDPPE